MNGWMEGLQALMDLQVILFIVLGMAIGIGVGAIPGLSATMGVVLFLPFTFALDPLPGMMLLLGIYAGALYAGSIPAVLIRTPGTPSAAATLLDGNPMALQGKAGQALTISLVASVLGGLVGVVLLSAFAPALAQFALAFGPAEYFMLSVLALTIIASLGENALIKGLLSGGLGLAIAMVGLDPIQGFPRFTFGQLELTAGIGFIPVMIGLFGVAEALLQYEKRHNSAKKNTVGYGPFKIGMKARSFAPVVGGSSVLGFIVGVLPGAGGDIGAFVAYNETKRFSRDKSRFGKGEPKGVAAAESANSASTGGALVPMLTLGIPGDSVSAVLIGAITVHGLRPGPQLFEGSPDLVYGMFLGFSLTHVAMLVLGLIGIRFWARLIKVREAYLWPTVLTLSVIGSYALRANLFDVLVMVAAGVLGYAMTKGGYPLAPLIIGLILGPIAEGGFRRAMIVSGGSLEWVLEPIPMLLLILSIASLGFSLWRARPKKSKVMIS